MKGERWQRSEDEAPGSGQDVDCSPSRERSDWEDYLQRNGEQQPFGVYVGRDKRIKPYLVNDLMRLKAVLRHHALIHDLVPMARGIVYEGRQLYSERQIYNYGLEQGSCIRIVRLTRRDRTKTHRGAGN